MDLSEKLKFYVRELRVTVRNYQEIIGYEIVNWGVQVKLL